MPQHSKGCRLYRRANGIWYIRDGAQFVSTRTRNRREADSALARYIAEKDRPAGPRDPSQMIVADVLDVYGRERAPHVADPARIAACIRALVPILGPLPVASVTGAVCRRYEKQRRRAPGTVRKELGTLAAAINYSHAEGYLTAAPRVRLPAKPPPRDRWLTRSEVAALLRACRRNPKARHLCRYILTAVYTGTRSEAILSMRFMPHTGGGYVDTETGLMHRRAAGKAETKKRTPTVPVPARLLAHLRRWERMGETWVVGIEGQRVGSVKRAWGTALRESGIDHATRHDLRHTAVTWAMQRGADKWQVAGFFGLSLDLIETVYGHHHPDHLQGVVEAMSRRA